MKKKKKEGSKLMFYAQSASAVSSGRMKKKKKKKKEGSKLVFYAQSASAVTSGRMKKKKKKEGRK